MKTKTAAVMVWGSEHNFREANKPKHAGTSLRGGRKRKAEEKVVHK